MKILTLGASGMMGTALDLECRTRGLEHAGLSHSDIELSDEESVRLALDRHRPHVVVNFVALVGINPCEERPAEAFALHGTAVERLARSCDAMGATLVQASTHAVFDGTKDDYYNEEDRPHPTSIYAGSKLLSEFFAESLCRRHYIVRFPTLFGPRRNSRPGFADKMLDLLRRGGALRVADDKIDSPTYSLDAAGAVCDILSRQLPYGIYHVANEGRTSYYDLVTDMARFLGLKAEIVRAKDREFPALAPKPLMTALRSLKLAPLRPWKNALQDYIVTYPSGRV